VPSLIASVDVKIAMKCKNDEIKIRC